ncbi:dihydrofolate synthetase Fol3 [Talaromyces stipitatus ATCC 10500]|uniref:Dihydrofolate synthetase Fol3 n=1 Tax=Talaromyces stipitatus (strain ATCC 10500 / CBS 375.48 / QM 6759 / NRRL 1006) TaxID=441959 RepID=B8LTT4_TALSN|nr:dihydrofolate synthetase Fol3 [Talaromyces stipitatus ATCC 10500]EED23676.1 dihydrofolate synthetase Fol3 [Talaromyces stipitatus ATCC 10500]
MIELGLSRISRLVQYTAFTWKAIHVAGTNGKGSITSYVSGLLTAAGVRCGRFTSPHLIDRWDCITINDKTVPESLFRQVEEQIKQRNQSLGVDASEFELLTATAFEIFDREHVEIGVVEVGMGGRLDATNILSNVLVSVIAKIGRDHEAFLGNSMEAIANEKAGILKDGVPCVVDGTNDAEVLQVIQSRIKELGIDATIATPDIASRRFPRLVSLFNDLDLEPHQRTNIACATLALQKAFEQTQYHLNVDDLVPRLSKIEWPGRLQLLSMRPLINREEPVLIDGAHNGQSANVLAGYVNRKLRRQGVPVTWVIAVSHGKDLSEILQPLMQSGDNAAIVAFGPVDGMPWVKATDTERVAEHIKSISNIGKVEAFGTDILSALTWASQSAKQGPFVIAVTDEITKGYT